MIMVGDWSDARDKNKLNVWVGLVCWEVRKGWTWME